MPYADPDRQRKANAAAQRRRQAKLKGQRLEQLAPKPRRKAATPGPKVVDFPKPAPAPNSDEAARKAAAGIRTAAQAGAVVAAASLAAAVKDKTIVPPDEAVRMIPNLLKVVPDAALVQAAADEAVNAAVGPPRTVEGAMDRIGRTGSTWRTWRAVARLLDGTEFDEFDRDLLKSLSGLDAPPKDRVSEIYAVMGRRSGKTSLAAVVAIVWACRRYPLADEPTVVFTATRLDQSKKPLRMAREVARQFGVLADEGNSTSFGVEGGVRVAAITNESTAVRGMDCVAVVMDEAAFYPSSALAADTDRMLLTAIKPTLATFRTGLLMVISTPGPGRGILYDAYQGWKRGERPRGRVLLHARTRTMNETISQEEIDAEIAEHPELRAEYASEFSVDVRAWLPAAATDPGVVAKLPAVRDHAGGELYAFVDAASGVGKDGFAAAVAETLEPAGEGKPRAQLLEVFHKEPPYDLDEAVKGAAALCRKYGVDEITGDKWATNTQGVSWRELGVVYRESEKNTSLIYNSVAGALTTGRALLLSDPLLIDQLRGLVEVPRDAPPPKVTHVNGGHDDVANAACGALDLALKLPTPGVWVI